ncbi:MAG TPA: hypothetical protein VE687_16455 [Stellaceae bacterium]|jgi:hypothetical protein|nr:hypothetical protein [Stellaceae bacterium]
MILRNITTALLVVVAGAASAIAAETGRMPAYMPPPTVYSAPTPAPVPPPINPGPATVPPAGLSPLLTQPGPVTPRAGDAMPAYPSPQLPGPTGQQNMQAYRNSLWQQQWQLERSGVSPDSERSREIQQQLRQ